MQLMGLTRRENMLKDSELRRSRDTLSTFDGALARATPAATTSTDRSTSGSSTGSSSKKPPPPPTRGHDKHLADLQTAGNELERGSKALRELLKKADASTVADAEIKEHLALVEARLDRLHAFEESAGVIPASNATGDTAQADALALTASSLAALTRLIERTGSAVEALVAGGSEVAEAPSDVDERVLCLLEWNEEREWLADKLRAAEGAVRDGRVQAERILGMREAIRGLIKSDESTTPSIDRSVFRPLLFDKAPSKPSATNGGKTSTSFAKAAAKAPEVRPTPAAAASTKRTPSEPRKASQPSLTAASNSKASSAPFGQPTNYRSAPCRSFWHRGYCGWGKECTFLHIAPADPADVPSVAWDDMKRPCQYFSAGHCWNGDACRLSHDMVVPLPEEAIAVNKIRPTIAKAGKTSTAGGSTAALVAASASKELAAASPQQAASAGSTKAKTLRERLIEANKVVSLYKTSLCKTYYSEGGCSLGDSCKMAHGEEEQRTSPEILKAVLALSNDPTKPYQYKLKERLCVNWMHSTCWHLKNCVMAHGLDELDPPVSVRKVTLCPKQEASGEPCKRPGCLWLHSSPEDAAARPRTPKNFIPAASKAEALSTSGGKKSISIKPARKPSPKPAPVMKLIRHAPAKKSAASSLASSSTASSKSGSPDLPLTPPDVAPSAGAPVALKLDNRAPAKPKRPTSALLSKPALLPLGPGACPNHLLAGNCANRESCLNRHILDASDFAAGVLPRLGPGSCLNIFLRGRCGNGDDCLSRHVLTEADCAVGGPSA